MKLSKFTQLTLTLALSSFAAKAQMVSGNIFLQGNHIEVGIGPRGNYGTDTSAPAGYHNTMATYTICGGTPHPLGLVADPAADGWTTGTPAAFGDYFLPGSPFEGWAIQSGSLRASLYGTVCTAPTGFTGSNTSYSSSGTSVSGTWDGMFDSLSIHKVTTLDTGALYFTTRVTITNISSAAKNDIYYLRTLDPDNDQTFSFNFATRNVIDYQLPNSLNATVVSSKGILYSSAYYAMGTVDTFAKCLIYSAWPLSAATTLDSVFNNTSTYLGTSYYGALDSMTNDVAIGIMFKIGHLASVDSAADSVGRTTSHPANSMTFTYFSSFGSAATDTAIVRLTPAVIPVDSSLSVHSISTVNEADIVIYPNPQANTLNAKGLAINDELTYYDLTGRQVIPALHAAVDGLNTFSIANLATGHYVLIVKDNTGTVKARIPVQKL